MIILASASPRRKELMEKEISSSFSIIVSDIDESLSFKTYSDVRDIVKDIAKRKCLKVSDEHPHDLVIAADTVVVIDNQIIGKPKDQNDARHMLRMLSGKTHYVYTGYAINKDDKLVSGVVKRGVMESLVTKEKSTVGVTFAIRFFYIKQKAIHIFF